MKAVDCEVCGISAVIINAAPNMFLLQVNVQRCEHNKRWLFILFFLLYINVRDNKNKNPLSTSLYFLSVFDSTGSTGTLFFPLFHSFIILFHLLGFPESQLSGSCQIFFFFSNHHIAIFLPSLGVTLCNMFCCVSLLYCNNTLLYAIIAFKW